MIRKIKNLYNKVKFKLRRPKVYLLDGASTITPNSVEQIANEMAILKFDRLFRVYVEEVKDNRVTFNVWIIDHNERMTLMPFDYFEVNNINLAWKFEV